MKKELKDFLLRTTAIVLIGGSLINLSYFFSNIRKLDPDQFRQSWSNLEECLNVRKAEPCYYSISNDLVDPDGFIRYGCIFIKEKFLENSGYPYMHEQTHILGIIDEDLTVKTVLRCENYVQKRKELEMQRGD